MAKSFRSTSTGVPIKAPKGLTPFLRSLAPGVGIVLQYDCQAPAFGIYQGFRRGHVLLSEFNGFPELVRIAANRINAVAPFAGVVGPDQAGSSGCGDSNAWSVYGSVADLGCCGGYWW